MATVTGLVTDFCRDNIRKVCQESAVRNRTETSDFELEIEQTEKRLLKISPGLSNFSPMVQLTATSLFIKII